MLSVKTKYFKFVPISPKHVLPIFCAPLLVSSCIGESLGRISISEVWNFSYKSDQTSPDCGWAPNQGEMCQWVWLMAGTVRPAISDMDNATERLQTPVTDPGQSKQWSLEQRSNEWITQTGRLRIYLCHQCKFLFQRGIKRNSGGFRAHKGIAPDQAWRVE